MKTLFLIAALMISSDCLAQQLSAVLVDRRTKRPISYVNVGIPGKNIGAVTDESGRFSLVPDPGSDADSLRLSMIGYEPLLLRVGDVRARGAAGEAIALEPRAEGLKEVVVRSRTRQHRRLGNTADDKHKVFGFEQYRPGYEVGSYIRIRRRGTSIDSVRINVAACDHDSIFLRLNIYEDLKAGLRNVLSEPIYIGTDTATAMHRLCIDLRDRNIVVNHNFVLSVELVKDLGAGKMYFCAELPGNRGYMRLTSQADWKTFIVGGPSFSAYVTY